jgi:uncharacterized protein (TIGR00255 family)
MTGFGDASTQHEGLRYTVEIKSLNNRYFKTVLKLPDAAASLEADIERFIRTHVDRGSIVYTLKIRADDETPASRPMARIDAEVLRAYIGQLTAAGLEVRDPERLLGLPGVVQPIDHETAAEPINDDEHRATVLELTRQAIAALMEMRRREGEMLLADLTQNTTRIAETVERIARRAGGVIEHYHDRLHHRVNELLAKAELQIDQAELAREVAVFADRSDISEEIQRLTHHVAEFERVCRSDEPSVGRKLDFMTQEMLREANTIASKANDATVAADVVVIKGAIDRLKEQVQNVE